MEYEFKVTYSKAIISQAYLNFWKTKYGFDAVLSVIFLIAVSILLFNKEATEDIVIFFFTIALVFATAIYSLYFICRKQAITTFNSMKNPDAQWKFTDENVQTESDIGKAELNWTVIKKIWRFEGVWLLFYGNGSFSVLPTDGLDIEALQFMENKVTKNGGEVLKY